MKAPNASACVACLALAAASAAAAMNDPTRPPASFSEAPAAGLRAPPVLQSIIIIGKGTRAAIIDGERVEIGGRFREARVVKITEEEVVLREDGMTQVLKMYPDVEKKTARVRENTAPKAPPRDRRP